MTGQEARFYSTVPKHDKVIVKAEVMLKAPVPKPRGEASSPHHAKTVPDVHTKTARCWCERPVRSGGD